MPQRTIQTSGATLNVMDTGSGEPSLLFLHYWGGSSRSWQQVIDQLDSQSRCIAIDQRGWGASVATNGRYDLDSMADDVQVVINTLKLDRYVLVGHSMGGKVSQIVAKRHPPGLAGLLLVAPAPPTPMPVPAEQRSAMLASYETHEGVLQALPILSGTPLSNSLCQQVITDTLGGTSGAKQAWTNRGMIEDISDGLTSVTVPISVVIGDRDQVEHESALRVAFSSLLPQTTFTVLPGVGHLSPIESPDAVASAARELLSRI
ncbi:alpha/beta fold hydrolase [Nostoc sp.]|uniref:alpha/beta fold hydrolase n=1 Tax=Nostoc sp. TaxID=1180 RepID=UPI002FF53F16